MANEQAVKDDNSSYGLLAHSADGLETRKVKQLANGGLPVEDASAPVYEDNVNGKAVVEHRYASSGLLTTDTQVKATAGFVHTVTISPGDAAPTAGTIDIYDNPAGTGIKIFSVGVPAAWFAPFSVLLDVVCNNGIYVDFTTTADVNVAISKR